MLRWKVIFEDGTFEWVSARDLEGVACELFYDESPVSVVECLGPAYED